MSLDLKRKLREDVSASQIEQALFAARKGHDLLWEVIDSLVDKLEKV